MATRIITCINKTDRMNPHERIKNIGGIWGQENQATAINQIEFGIHDYYVTELGLTVKVIVEEHNGHKYIKTKNDGAMPDNLLSLPECPSK